MQNTQSNIHKDPSFEQALSPAQLESWCNDFLQAGDFKDYSPNGLQVDGGQPIRKLITGVTATQYLIDEAINANADAIVVHHGYFWKGEYQPLIGMKGKRIRTLMQSNMSLLAYHLPLDAHPEIGNNAVLAKQLGLTIIGGLYPAEANPVGNVATCEPQPIGQLINTITTALNRTPLHIPANRFSDNPTAKMVQKIGICTGGAQDMIEQAHAMGCEAFISGEISERTTHFARELGIDYLACGHHATEVGGVKALGEVIGNHFELDVQFIDDPNPA